MAAATAVLGNTAESACFISSAPTWPTTAMCSRARADRDIVPAPAPALAAKGRSKAKRSVVSRKEVEAMRPDRTEIIIGTGFRTRGARQDWFSVAGPFL